MSNSTTSYEIIEPVVPDVSPVEMERLLSERLDEFLRQEYGTTAISKEDYEKLLQEVQHGGFVIIPTEDGNFVSGYIDRFADTQKHATGTVNLGEESVMAQKVGASAEKTAAKNQSATANLKKNLMYIVAGLVLTLGFLWYNSSGSTDTGAKAEPTIETYTDAILSESLPAVGVPVSITLPDNSTLAVAHSEKEAVGGAFGWCDRSTRPCWLYPSLSNVIIGVPTETYDTFFARINVGDELSVSMGSYDVYYVVETVSSVLPTDTKILSQSISGLTIVETVGRKGEPKQERRYIYASVKVEKTLENIDEEFAKNYLDINIPGNEDLLPLGNFGSVEVKRYLASQDGATWKTVLYLYPKKQDATTFNELQVTLNIGSDSFFANETQIRHTPENKIVYVYTFLHPAPPPSQSFNINLDYMGDESPWPNYDGVYLHLPTTPLEAFKGLHILGVTATYNRDASIMTFHVRYFMDTDAPILSVSTTLKSSVTNDVVTPIRPTSVYLQPSDYNEANKEQTIDIEFLVSITDEQIKSGHIPELEFKFGNRIYLIKSVKEVKPTPTPTPNGPTPTPTPAIAQYIVQEGDTSWSIAKAHGITVDELQSLNPGTDLTKIYPGDIIYVPAN